VCHASFSKLSPRHLKATDVEHTSWLHLGVSVYSKVKYCKVVSCMHVKIHSLIVSLCTRSPDYTVLSTLYSPVLCLYWGLAPISLTLHFFIHWEVKVPWIDSCLRVRSRRSTRHLADMFMSSHPTSLFGR
jgi:hypothetical protein